EARGVRRVALRPARSLDQEITLWPEKESRALLAERGLVEMLCHGSLPTYDSREGGARSRRAIAFLSHRPDFHRLRTIGMAKMDPHPGRGFKLRLQAAGR